MATQQLLLPGLAEDSAEGLFGIKVVRRT
jgi:hypothetical protein